jgi:DNA-binding beta-propeller fold protein YncE
MTSFKCWFPLFILGVAFLGSVLATRAEEPQLVQTIPLDGVEGRIDHMSMDVKGERLFVAALGNNTVQIVDLAKGEVFRYLPGLSEPQGTCFIPEFNLLVVANGGDGRCLFFDGTTFNLVGTISLGEDADNVRYDAQRKKVLVGYGNGALAVIDPQTRKVVSTIPLSAHPESFQADPSGPKIFVNIPDSHALDVVDMEQKKVIGNFALGLVAANFPMALDVTDHRLFIGCRLPSRLLVFDTQTGNKVASLTLHGDCDDVFYDAAQKQIYASCGEGFLDCFSQSDADHYSLKQAIATAGGARTSYFDGNKIYLAVPHRGSQSAEIRVFKTQ